MGNSDFDFKCTDVCEIYRHAGIVQLKNIRSNYWLNFAIFMRHYNVKYYWVMEILFVQLIEKIKKKVCSSVHEVILFHCTCT